MKVYKLIQNTGILKKLADKSSAPNFIRQQAEKDCFILTRKPCLSDKELVLQNIKAQYKKNPVTQEEIEAIIKYKEFTNYKSINGYLRYHDDFQKNIEKTRKKLMDPGLDNEDKEFFGRIYNESVRKNKELENTVYNLDKVIKKTSTDRPLTLYRGVMLHDESGLWNAKLGDLFEEKSYISTSWNLDAAKEYAELNSGLANPRGRILRIHIPKNSKILDYSAFSEIKHCLKEEEILLPRDSKFKVTGIDNENNIIDVELASQHIRNFLHHNSLSDFKSLLFTS